MRFACAYIVVWLRAFMSAASPRQLGYTKGHRSLFSGSLHVLDTQGCWLGRYKQADGAPFQSLPEFCTRLIFLVGMVFFLDSTSPAFHAFVVASPASFEQRGEGGHDDPPF
jgi:hypothetical protein